MHAPAPHHWTVHTRTRARIVVLTVLAGLFSIIPVVHGQVTVRPSPTTDNHLSGSPTSDNIAVSETGTVYVVWQGAGGIQIARSTDGGTRFESPTTLARTGAVADVQVSSDGHVYVAFVQNEIATVVRSTDGGKTFGAPVRAGPSPARTVQLVTVNQTVYLVPQTGDTMFVSTDGGRSFSSTPIERTPVASDGANRRHPHRVVVHEDGSTAAYTLRPDSVEHSSVAASPSVKQGTDVASGDVATGPRARHLFVAGAQAVRRIDIASDSSTVILDDASRVHGPPSVDVDRHGNVVMGWIHDGVARLRVRPEWGAGDGPTVRVDSATAAEVAINDEKGEVLVLYEQNGQIVLHSYVNRLPGYALNPSPASLQFGEIAVGDTSDAASVMLSNDASRSVAVSVIRAPAAFTVTNDCPNVVDAGEECSVHVRFSPSSPGTFSDTLNIVTKRADRSSSVVLTGHAREAPDVAVVDGSVAELDFDARVVPGASHNPVGILGLRADRPGATVEGVTVRNGAPGISGMTAVRLFWSADRTLDPRADTLLASLAVDSTRAPGTLSFDELHLAIQTTPHYLILAIDVQEDVPVGDLEFFLESLVRSPSARDRRDAVGGNGQGPRSRLPLSNGAASLPVAFTSLDAQVTQRGVVALDWTTASETRNERFDVERIVRGVRNSTVETAGAWKTIGSVEGAGTTDRMQSYEFLDRDAPYDADTLGYRLRHVDLDGTAHYTEPIFVSRRGRTHIQMFGVSPHPVRQEGTIRYVIRGRGTGQLALFNVLGKKVRTLETTLESGRHETRLDARGLSSGIYFVQLRFEETVKTIKVTVVR